MITKSVNAGCRSETTINTFSDHDSSPGAAPLEGDQHCPHLRLACHAGPVYPSHPRRRNPPGSRDKQAHRGSGVARPGRTGDEMGAVRRGARDCQ
jgi:hypothetical protein